MKPLRWKLPNLGIGVGLRTVHYGHVLSQKPTIDFFELLSENYMDTGGRPIRVAEQAHQCQSVDPDCVSGQGHG